MSKMASNWLRHRRCLLLLLLAVTLLWGDSLVNLSVDRSSSGNTHQLKDQIVSLSEEYVKALARENGPYVGRFTSFDVEKTISVLLESMLSRINRLESFINHTTNGTVLAKSGHHLLVADKSDIFSAKYLLEGRSESYVLNERDKAVYPHCQHKIVWMQHMWQSDPCYAAYGVDGSNCSIIMFLSEVENFCPRMSWVKTRNNTAVGNVPKVVYANLTLDVQALMEILVDPNERRGYAWIRMRISDMWPRWTEAARSLAAQSSFRDRVKQNILIHLGLLSNESGWKFAEMQFKGGPLGELVQWSDLISTLYILGHHVTVTSEVEQIVEILKRFPSAKSPCQASRELPVNLIYTDIKGLIQFKRRLNGGYRRFSCLFRVLDSFGTEPAFNCRTFAKQNKILSSWGGHDLNPRQFFTMFPHSPDNSFMGFVVDQPLWSGTNSSITNTTDGVPNKKDIALVYGKNDYIWKSRRKYLDAVHQHLEIHSTVYAENDSRLENVPNYVINHGILSGTELRKLLQQTKIFIGMGFPYEGPAPLEAIASGAVYINPAFDPPHSNKNQKFFKGKPTRRELTSQHPYAEKFIGEPYVYTVDINNTDEVNKTIRKIISTQQFQGHLPLEYTEEGMLHRVNAFIQNQNFCTLYRNITKWPPKVSIQFQLGQPAQSCQDACWSVGRLCEPEYFHDVNSEAAFKNLTACNSWTRSTNIYYPSVDTLSQVCTLQGNPMLYSCVGSMDNLRRLCPCRDFIQGQSALCLHCAK